MKNLYYLIEVSEENPDLANVDTDEHGSDRHQL